MGKWNVVRSAVESAKSQGVSRSQWEKQVQLKYEDVFEKCSKLGLDDQYINTHYTFNKWSWLFEKLQRPTWLIPNEVVEVVHGLELSNEDRLLAIENMPYPIFAMVFERESGATIRPRELTWLAVSREGVLGITEKGPFLSHEMNSYAAHVVTTLLMLWRCRPEYAVPATLSRTERYNFKGNRELIRQWKFPDALIRRIKDSSIQDAKGKWTVRPHWRAGHFRHYRHERFERDEQGRVRVEFIEPCMVHAEELVGNA